MFRRLTILLVAILLPAAAYTHSFEFGKTVDSPQGRYAQRMLSTASPVAMSASVNIHVDLAIDPKLGAEAYSIRSRNVGKTLKSHIVITGGDARGLIYGAMDVREQLLAWKSPGTIQVRTHTPRLAFRGIKLNTPWDSYRPSSAIDQHTATMKDLKFWEAYLDMMVENRFNSFTLWTEHPFTYMIRPANFPEASKWSDAEFAEWQRLYREIFRMAKERSLDTYVVFWSIFVSEEFARAHLPGSKNFYPHYYVDGDTSDITKKYLRESVTQMLLEYPDLDGIGVSHGEGMGGMTPLQRQHFVDEVYVAGALEARKKRPVKLIHRVPFSSGLSSGPGVSADVEKITRGAMEKLGNQFSGPIWVEMKFNWSHGHSTPKLIKVHGGKLGDTYFKPTPSNYRVVWQVRNEDFFALRWGSPDFIRAHIRENGMQDHVGGYFIGSETYLPALDYFSTKVGNGRSTSGSRDPADWRWAFERQWLYYKTWGRLLYDPATPDAAFDLGFRARYGDVSLLDPYKLVSEVPLTLAKIYDSRWDFTLYAEGFLALQGEITKYIGVDALIAQPTLDPDYQSVKDFVGQGPRGITPLQTADGLETRSQQALRALEKIRVSNDPALEYELADIRTWANLGLHLAEKLRGAVALQTYRVKGGAENQQAAVAHLANALKHWDEVIRVTRPIYKDMPLTHYNHNAFVANPDNLFHWARIRDEVAADVDVARKSTTK